MCFKIVGIPDTTNETKVCDLIETVSGMSIIPDSLEACHCLPPDEINKLIIKLSRRKDAEVVLSKKPTKIRASVLAVLVLKVVKSSSMNVSAATISSYGVNAKLFGQRNGLKLSELAMRGGSRAAATSKVERFVIIVNGLQPLTIIPKRSILDVAAVLHLPLGQIKIRIEPEGAVSRITHITGLQKLFPIISV